MSLFICLYTNAPSKLRLNAFLELGCNGILLEYDISLYSILYALKRERAEQTEDFLYCAMLYF